MRWVSLLAAVIVAAGVYYVLPPSHAAALASWDHVTSQFKACAEPAATFGAWPISTTCDGLTIVADSTSHSRDDLCRIEIIGNTAAPRALMTIVNDAKRVRDLQLAVSELRRPYYFDGVVAGIHVYVGVRFSLDAC